jgi:DNA-binding MarR family transcriptional regulator
MTEFPKSVVAATDTVEATLTASRALLGVVARSLVDALHEVSMPQFRILVVLTSAGPMRIGTLAYRMNALPSTFTRAINRMVDGGWVERAASPDSRREVLIRVTPKGRAVVDEVTERRRAELSRILLKLTPEEQAAVQRGLETFSRAAQEVSAEELIILGL